MSVMVTFGCFHFVPHFPLPRAKESVAMRENVLLIQGDEKPNRHRRTSTGN